MIVIIARTLFSFFFQHVRLRCKTIEWDPGTDDNRIHLYATGADSCRVIVAERQVLQRAIEPTRVLPSESDDGQQETKVGKNIHILYIKRKVRILIEKIAHLPFSP